MMWGAVAGHVDASQPFYDEHQERGDYRNQKNKKPGQAYELLANRLYTTYQKHLLG
jgi:hypothetical protein